MRGGGTLTMIVIYKACDNCFFFFSNDTMYFFFHFFSLPSGHVVIILTAGSKDLRFKPAGIDGFIQIVKILSMKGSKGMSTLS